jgi:DNA-binding XRE family transcriptional regulator
MEITPQIIRTASGEELIVLTRAEYDALRAAAADEDTDDVAMFDARMAELQAGTDARLPAEVTALMLRGDPLAKALRKWRGLTQLDLAATTGLSQGYISDIEAGAKKGAPETLRKIAEALQIDPVWLADG